MKRFLMLAMLLSCGAAINAQEAEKPTVYMVANAHLDTQWRWDVQQVIGEFIPNTMYQNFALIEEFPDYIFNFEGADKYMWMKEYYPEQFEKVKKYVASGNWHIAGSSWDANDHNLPSIEACIRNYLYGQKFYEEEFGVKGTDIMLPDCFGFGITMPSIADHCGIIGFHTQKLQWRGRPFYGDKKVPFRFGIWEGIDGSKIMASLDGGDYSWDPSGEINDLKDLKDRIADNQAYGVNSAFRYFGTRSSRYHGDQGGSPTRWAVLAVEEARKNPKDYNMEYATVDKMFKDYYMKESLPVFKGELLMDIHATGCYTSHTELKKINRINEWLLVSAEQAGVLGEWTKALSYPQYTLDEAWKRVLMHQFHDDLTGTSFPRTYYNTYKDEYAVQSQLEKIIEREVLALSTALDTKVKGTPVVVYNPVTAAVRGTAMVEIALPASAKGVTVTGPDGKKVNSFIVSRDGDKAVVAFAVAPASMSLSVYDIVAAKSASKASVLKASGKVVENRIYRVELNADGDICSILDKRCGKELVKEGEAIGLAAFAGNRSDRWPAWEIERYVMEREPSKVNTAVNISVEECNALRAVLRVEKKYGESTFVQKIVLTDGAADDRIDIVNEVNWKSKETLLKASFPLSVSNPEATYDLGMASIKRDNNTDIKYEVFAHQWADLTATDDSYGVTVMNDSRYGWDKPNDHTIRLTLLHTPDIGNAYDKYQTTMDLGEHVFTYSIVGHPGALNTAEASIKSDNLNRPVFAYATAKHAGSGKSMATISSSNPSMRIKAFKKAYDGDGYIVRLYELSGKGGETTVTLPANILSAEEVNGLEETVGAASFSGKNLTVKADGFKLKTYRVRLAESTAKVVAESYETLDIPFNEFAITTNAWSSLGHMTEDWQSYAAEVIPANMEFAGVPFKMGRGDDKNSVMCKGQVIALPEGTKTVYMLAASKDKDVDATFVAGAPVVREVDDCREAYGMYGWEGYYDSMSKNGTVAYIGSHMHDSRKRDLIYQTSYMFLVEVPVAAGARELILPEDPRVNIFAATAAK